MTSRLARRAAVLALFAVALVAVPPRLGAVPLTYDVRGEFEGGELAGAPFHLAFTYETDAVEPLIDTAQAAPVELVEIDVPGVLAVTTAEFDAIDRSRLGTFADRFFFLEFGGTAGPLTLGLGLGLTFDQSLDLRAPLPLGTVSSTGLFLNVFDPERRFSGTSGGDAPLSVALREPVAVPAPIPATLVAAGMASYLVAVRWRASRTRPGRRARPERFAQPARELLESRPLTPARAGE